MDQGLVCPAVEAFDPDPEVPPREVAASGDALLQLTPKNSTLWSEAPPGLAAGDGGEEDRGRAAIDGYVSDTGSGDTAGDGDAGKTEKRDRLGFRVVLNVVRDIWS